MGSILFVKTKYKIMDLICINDSYTEDQLRVFNKHRIRTPKLHEIVQLVRIDKLLLRGKIGLIVAPYDNQWIIDKGFEKEVSFDKSRFVTLNQEVISEEMIKSIDKTEKV